jgi:hypothetical protein
MSPQYQSFRVARDGADYFAVEVTVNGIRISHTRDDHFEGSPEALSSPCSPTGAMFEDRPAPPTAHQMSGSFAMSPDVRIFIKH